MAERRDRIRVHIADQEFNVVGGKFQEMLAAVKQIAGRRFVGELKVWQLPGPVEDVQNQLDISGFHLEGGIPLAGPVSSTPAPPRSGGDRIRVSVQGHQLAVVGGSFQEMLAAVKNLPGRRFDGEAKIWEVPGELSIIKNLIEAVGFRLEGAENIPPGPVPTMEPPDFDRSYERDIAPPPFEEPDFLGDDEAPPFEPPDWWDDESMPPSPSEPPDWWADEMDALPPDAYDDAAESPTVDHKPPSFQSGSPPPAVMDPTSPPRGGDQIRIRVGGIPLVVTGGSFREMLAVVKNIPGRRFNGAEKVWEIPGDVTLDAVQQVVKAAGFVVKRG